jgi:hypothetical protein
MLRGGRIMCAAAVQIVVPRTLFTAVLGMPLALIKQHTWPAENCSCTGGKFSNSLQPCWLLD